MNAPPLQTARPTVWLVCLTLLCGGLTLCAMAQAPTTSFEFPNRTRLNAQKLPRDPFLLSKLQRAGEMLENGEIPQALQALQEILDLQVDFFIQDESLHLVNMLSQVEGLIQKHSDEYERQFGQSARQLLNEAISQQNLRQIEDVVRRYELTKAGMDALQLIAQRSRDGGQFSRAARYQERLAKHAFAVNPRAEILLALADSQTAGDFQQVDRILKTHQELLGDEPTESFLVPVANLPGAQDVTQYEWRLPTGSANQTGQIGFAPAFSQPVWNQSMLHELYDIWLLGASEVSEKLAQETRLLMAASEQRVRSSASRVAMPAARPLIVNGLVILPGPGSLKAFRLDTGELVWNGLPIDETFEYLTKSSASSTDSGDSLRNELKQLFFGVRGWRDLTSMALSTDGERVYAVSDSQLLGSSQNDRLTSNQRHPLSPGRSNHLIAYDLKSEGKLAWPMSLAPSRTADQFGMPLSQEVFYLGAPLPVEDQLFVLGEQAGQVQLIELDPATGNTLWSVGLINPTRELSQDEFKRMSGLTPTYAAGLLICPTGEGAVVAVDPIKKQVVWTHFYQSLPSLFQRDSTSRMQLRIQAIGVAEQTREEFLKDDRWFDSRLVAVDNRVIFTPSDSIELLILNLHDGTPVQPVPIFRNNAVSLATIYEDEAILIGKSEITSVSLTDSPRRWNGPIAIPSPSGRGVRMGDRYLQPLSTGEIAVIDLKQGRLLTRFPMPDKRIPGNIVAADGHLLVQSSYDLIAFKSLDAVNSEISQLIAVNPNDPQALGLQGALKLQSGDLDGLRQLEEIGALSPDSPIQQIIVWTVLEGLKSDFAQFRMTADRLIPTLKDPAQKLLFLRAYAEELARTGETLKAFEHFLQILEQLPENSQMIQLTTPVEVDESRWVLGQLYSLLESADAPLRPQLSRSLFDWVKQAPPEKIERLLPAVYAGWMNPAFVIPSLLNQPHLGNLDLQRESILRTAMRSGHISHSLLAANELLNQAVVRRDGKVAQEMLDFLKTHSHETFPTTGQPVSELIASLEAGQGIQNLLAQQINWDQPIHVGELPGPPSRTSLNQIQRLGAPSQELAGWTFFLDQAGGRVEVFDQDGRHRAYLSAGYSGLRYATEIELSRYVMTHRHLAIVVLLDRMLMIDLLSDPNNPQLMFSYPLVESNEPMLAIRPALGEVSRFGLRTSLTEVRAGQWSGHVGPISDSLVCYTIGSNLVALDPTTGKELWKRRDIKPGSEVLSDDMYVLVSPPDEPVISVYRAIDGQFVKTSPIPSGTLFSQDRSYGDWGRYIPVKSENETEVEWGLYDPAKDVYVWKHSAPRGTRSTIVEGTNFAFLTRNGELTVLEGQTGKVLLTSQVSGTESAEQFSMLRYPDSWILGTNTNRTEAPASGPFSTGHIHSGLVEVQGILCAIKLEEDSATTQALTKPETETVLPEADEPSLPEPSATEIPAAETPVSETAVPAAAEATSESPQPDPVPPIVEDAVPEDPNENPPIGKILWSRPIAGANLVKNAPRDWPFLLLSRGRGQVDNMVIDRRTGDIVRQQMGADDNSGINWNTEINPLRVNLRFAQDRFVLFIGQQPPSKQDLLQAPLQSE